VEIAQPNEGKRRLDMAIHRIIEAHAARAGDAPAIAEAGITLSYRELNQRANAVARHLIAHGFKRGGIVTVCQPRAAETAVVLLGILKAGGTYVLIDCGATSDGSWPRGVSFAEKNDGDEVRYRTVDIAPALQEAPRSSANLPILARESDVACVITDRDGSPMLVPHATIMSLQRRAESALAEWSGEAGALDLWAGLLSGATVTLNAPALRSAA
jgi:non-ribosomal peptide synthetase component F